MSRCQMFYKQIRVMKIHSPRKSCEWDLKSSTSPGAARLGSLTASPFLSTPRSSGISFAQISGNFKHRVHVRIDDKTCPQRVHKLHAAPMLQGTLTLTGNSLLVSPFCSRSSSLSDQRIISFRGQSERATAERGKIRAISP